MDTWTYVVLVGAVVLVLALLIPKAKQEQANAGTTSNMEIALEQFMENTELDHKELVQLVTKFREQSHAQAEAKEQRITELERRLAQLETQANEAAARLNAMPQEVARQAAEASVVQAVAPAAQPAAEPVLQVQEPDPVSSAVSAPNTIQARYAELLELYSQGKSIELIAKKLGMNKGEVQLILQLAKQEEVARA
ncbi:DUF6115 domain-containing protein [Paenibacillus sp. NPDC058174]|uniref:DUF6115 domain-containing protein n=1 Tax=Paenibacillus sp. NPDC058174 TaxID=3346366 RepID=UPI0036D9A2E8